MAATIKVSLNLPLGAVETLRQIAAEEQITFTTALRRCIVTSTWLAEVQREGAKVLVERDGETRELVFFRSFPSGLLNRAALGDASHVAAEAQPSERDGEMEELVF